MTWTHLDTFSGIGGFALAAAWTGRIRTLQFVEIDPWCRRVLAKHWPGVPIHDDIRTFLADAEYAEWWAGHTEGHGAGGWHALLQGAEGAGDVAPRRLDLLTGGFPCQPFSAAGKRQGQSDDRYLWPELARIVAALRPRWCLFENVPGITNMVGGLERVWADLEASGYEVGAVVVPAAAVGAPHRRDRVWIVAHLLDPGCAIGDRNESRQRSDEGLDVADTSVQPERGPHVCADAHSGRGKAWEVPPSRGLTAGDVPVAHAERRDGCAHNEGESEAGRNGPSGASDGTRNEALSCLGDGTHGVSRGLPQRPAFGPDWEADIPRVTQHEPDRVNKLKALGNAIVPQVAYELLMVMLAVDDQYAAES